jgi:hypothetical protein
MFFVVAGVQTMVETAPFLHISPLFGALKSGRSIILFVRRMDDV